MLTVEHGRNHFHDVLIDRQAVINDTHTAARAAEAATLHRLHARQPSDADIASAAECAAAGKHQWAADVTGRRCCVVCGEMG